MPFFCVTTHHFFFIMMAKSISGEKTRSVTSELKKTSYLVQSLEKIRMLLKRNPAEADVLKYTLKKILILFCSRKKNRFPGGNFFVQFKYTFQVVMDCMRIHDHTPVEVFEELVQNKSIPDEKLFTLAKTISCYHRKASHLLTWIFLRGRLFPELGENETVSLVHWQSDSFSIDLYQFLFSSLQYIIRQCTEQTTNCFLSERREAVIPFLRLIPHFRTKRSLKTNPGEEEIWTNIIMSFKRIGCMTIKCKNIDDELKEQINAVVHYLVSVSVIRS